MATNVSRVVVVSLGNPGPYREALHSAGHFALESLRRELGLPAFAKQKVGGSKHTRVLVSANPRYVLVQSPTYMNESGPFVARAWKEQVQELTKGQTRDEAVPSVGLVVLHDDLEEDPGVVRVRAWDRSHRGHNGLKSINGAVRRGEYPPRATRWGKISVGIGRPAARDANAVSDYVLAPITSAAKNMLENETTGSRVLHALRQVESAWETEAAAVAAAAEAKKAGGAGGAAATEATLASTANSPKKQKSPKTRPKSQKAG